MDNQKNKQLLDAIIAGEAAKQELEPFIVELACNLYDMRIGGHHRGVVGWRVSEFDPNCIDVDIDVSTCGCCHDTYCIGIPFSYLLSDDWKKLELEWQRAKKEEKEKAERLELEKKEAAKEEKKKQQEEQEKEIYQILKKKFEAGK